MFKYMQDGGVSDNGANPILLSLETVHELVACEGREYWYIINSVADGDMVISQNFDNSLGKNFLGIFSCKVI
jgi:hypothetical protein